ncbi:MAG: alpha/beta hydrolase [Halobacteriota archaeon]|nr:alpha/beta hydrolase [Halobacteriota archaeon]
MVCDSMVQEGLKHEYQETNGIKMHYVTKGSGRLVVFLHGFPEFWYSWRHQLSAIGSEKIKAVAPDMRGYGKTDKPEGVENYKISILAQDILGLIRGLGEDKAVIVGHDWGGAVAWHFAQTLPEHTDKLIILNCPPPSVLKKQISDNPDQQRRSTYIKFFQQEKVPEKTLSANNYSGLKMALTSLAVKKDLFTEADLEKYVDALKLPALSCAINYYRASYQFPPDKETEQLKVKSETMVVWGEQDNALGIELTKQIPNFVEGELKINYVPTAGHWVQHEEPELVNKYILDFLG